MQVSVLVFFFALLIFLPGVSHSVFGGDSGDVILASWFGGVAHPPGYPINTIVGWVFTHLPFNASVAYKANLVAAFLQASSIAILFLIIKKITKNYFAAIFGSFVLALNPLFWLYAHVYEVFQLNLVLSGIAVYFLIAWRDEFAIRKTKSKKYLYLFSFFWGLSVFHHHTSALLGPAFLYFVLKTSERAFLKLHVIFRMGVFFLLGLIPYVFIPLAAARETPINWNDPQTLKNFLRLIIRADYGTFTAANFLVGSTLIQKFVQIANYFLFLKSDFSVLGLLIIAMGMIYSFFKNRVVFWFVMLAFVFSGPFFLVFAGFPITNDFFRALWERFLLTSYFFVAIFMGIGYKFLSEVVFGRFSSKVKIFNLGKDYTKLLLTLSLFTIPFAMFLMNYPKADLSRFQLGNWLGSDILTSAEPNSLIFLIGDTALFNTQYVFYTRSDNQNKKVIKAGSIAYLEYRRQLEREYPDLIFPREFFLNDEPQSAKYMAILMAANVDKFPIYMRDFSSNVSGYRWTNVGLLKKLEKNDEDYSAEKLVKVNEGKFSKFEYKDFGAKLGYSHFMAIHIKDYYYSSLTSLSSELLNLDEKESSVKYAIWAAELLPLKKDAYIILGNIYGRFKDCDLARENFEMVIRIDPDDWHAYEALSTLYSDCFSDESKSKEMEKKAKELMPKAGNDLKSF